MIKKKLKSVENGVLPHPVFNRLAAYKAHVADLCRQGQPWVSSRVLAEVHGQSASTVRQDLSYVDCTGVAHKGYDAQRLFHELNELLACCRGARVVIVGCGRLGCALAQYGGFAGEQVSVCGLFDSDPGLVGRRVGLFAVRPLADLPGVVKEADVEVGILTVPGAAAQQAADDLVKAGVRGLLNVSGVHVDAPAGLPVAEVRLLVALQDLLYRIRSRENRDPPGGERGAPPRSGMRMESAEEPRSNAAGKEKEMARVLIVDDDPDLVEASKTVLDSEGYECATASNRREGLEQVDAFAPDIILLDVMMEQPDDGIAMAQELRRKGVATPILLLTGISKLAGMDFGADREMVPVDAYLEKPVDPGLLLAKVKELLSGKA